MLATLILCAHNPATHTLLRVIDSCLSQLNASTRTELIVVDSASDLPLGPFPGARVVRVEKPGLARARARGIEEGKGDFFLFVDDDTILEPEYVSTAIRIFGDSPHLGAIGGQLIPEYTAPLELPEKYYRERLAIREFTGSHWSNRWDDFDTSPIGGGMGVRREPAIVWSDLLRTTPWRHRLGRRGNALAGGEDFDLIYTVCAMGYGKGIFSQLRLRHVIPPQRLSRAFLIRITEGNARSWAYLRGMLEPELQIPTRSVANNVTMLLKAARRKGLERQLYLAQEAGTWLGWAEVDRQRRSANPAKA